METLYKIIKWITLGSAILTIISAIKPYWEKFKMDWELVIPLLIFVISFIIWVIISYRKSKQEQIERITKLVLAGIGNITNPLAATIETSHKNLDNAIQGIDKLRKELEKAGHIKPDPTEERSQKILIDSLQKTSK